MKKRLSVIITVLVCVVCGLLFFPIPHKAQIVFPYFVTTTSDNVVAGACQAGVNNPGCSLRGAILRANEAANNDLIFFDIPASFCSAGVCTINLTTSLPSISTDMIISGPGADKLTVKAAAGVQIRIFSIIANPGTFTISGLTISNGSVSNGGGVLNFNTGTVNITNCVISGNNASVSGGGIENDNGIINVSNSTITGNSASSGAGLYNQSGTLNVINSTISGNFASDNGGGIFNLLGTVNVTNSTISGNSGTNGGGGIFKSSGTINVKSSIIALNTSSQPSPDVNGAFVSAGFNLIRVRNGSMGFEAATDQTGTIAAPLNPGLDPAGLQNNGGPTRTIRLLTGSPAIDKATSNGLTGNLITDQRGTGFPRTFDNPLIPNAAGGNGTDIGSFERGAKTPFDFDGDGKTDIGIFRPGPGEWWINRSSNATTFALQFGASTDKITPGDYTGDGKTDVAFWRPSNGNWFVLRSEDFSFFSFPFGTTNDVPVPADYDADGKTDAAVFRPSSVTWFISRSTGGTDIVTFGAPGDKPVAADYDGDGKADIAIFRPFGASGAEWWVRRSSNQTNFAVTFGTSTDKAVQGDYTGDGKADIAFWRPSTGFWFILRSEDFSFFSFPFGASTDVPVPGDYDGDGKFDAGVFRPSETNWYVQRSTAGTLIQQFGIAGDRPVPSAFVP